MALKKEVCKRCIINDFNENSPAQNSEFFLDIIEKRFEMNWKSEYVGCIKLIPFRIKTSAGPPKSCPYLLEQTV